ncbi:unnamed protein product [Peniophora sp. CBMAI 1063]|nr:unnamed protein product [Peniophora sp. CBMAI 1063]
MDSFDSYNYQPSASGSRLLSETLPSGSVQDDLSLSELSLADRPSQSRPFSLLPRHEDPATPVKDGGDDVEVTEVAPEEEHVEQDTAQTREERLSNDLYTLRKLNAAFGMYNEALAATESGTEVLAAQLEQTNTLLNMYVSLLGKTEDTARLIFDEEWQGASADEAALEEEVRQREEQRQREEEERAEAERREREIREREERERQAKEEQARLAREKTEKSSARSTSGVRGVRGTRASMRASASRGASSRGASASVTGRPTAGVASVMLFLALHELTGLHPALRSLRSRSKRKAENGVSVPRVEVCEIDEGTVRQLEDIKGLEVDWDESTGNTGEDEDEDFGCGFCGDDNYQACLGDDFNDDSFYHSECI